MNSLSLEFEARQVAKLTETAPGSIQNWVNRKLIIGHKEIGGGGGHGKRRKFSFFNVMEIAIARELMALGVEASLAFEGGGRFSHSANELASLPRRLPALPFHHSHGRTLIGFTPERSCEALFVLRDGKMNNPCIDIRAALHSDHFLIVDASRVFETVCARMGYDYRAVLDEAYGVQG